MIITPRKEADAIVASSDKPSDKHAWTPLLWSMVGKTPMIEIAYSFNGRRRSIFAKCEQFNLTGSIKDRMALYIIQKAYEIGSLKPGDVIVEATSGNTGISLAAIGRRLGHPVKIFMPDWLSNERVSILRSYGADVVGVSQESGGFVTSIRMACEMASENSNVFYADQFANVNNVFAHQLTGQEIYSQLQSVGITPDAFVAGVGTGGTIMGVGNFLRARNEAILVHPIEPAESPTMSTGFKQGHHRIQGISDEFIPAIVQLDELDTILQVHDGDAIIAAQMLACELGLAVGISSGANFLGAVQIQNTMGDDFAVVTVFPDSNKKYLSTDLVRSEPLRDHYLSKKIELLDYKPLPRLERNASI
jgi:cysteine synthase A